MKKIKIMSGWSNPGGSTVAFINLCTLLGRKGYDCTFYGPHEWHLDKCKSALMTELKINKDDTLIFHFLPLTGRPPAKKVLLSCHEKNVFEVGKITPYWDEVVFLNKKQNIFLKNYSV